LEQQRVQRSHREELHLLQLWGCRGNQESRARELM